ncbi:MAG: error-prone DNA polymerase [Phycisphaerales bacterium]|nr:error-prone DNA polymerase [Planctomycetota bacterium]
MPELEFPKLKPHPFRRVEGDAVRPWDPAAVPFAELCVTSNYTFLTGASHPEEFVLQAGLLGYRAISLTDTHTLAGVVRAHVEARNLRQSHNAKLQFVLGSRVRLMDVPACSIFLYPAAMDSYRRLCRLLTLGKRRAPKGECRLFLDDLKAHCDGMLGILADDGGLGPEFQSAAELLLPLFDDDRLSLAAAFAYCADDQARLERLAHLGDRLRVPLVATNDAHYHHADRRMLHDVLACIRHGCTLEQAGFRLNPNAEKHLKPAHEMKRLFAGYPGAIERSVEIARRVQDFSLDQLRYEYPHEVVPPGKTAQQHLTDLTWKGAGWRYGGNVPDHVRQKLEHELRLIDELNYPSYFLTVHDLVRFARTGKEREDDADPVPGWRGEILCQGRGAAANSAVCFCLGVTSVDPTKHTLLFERFVSKERNEPPDIDIDFEHERREEVIQYIYRKYGRERAALTAEVISYRRRSAVRDVGKALGLSLDLVDRLAKSVEWFEAGTVAPEKLREFGLNPHDVTLQWLPRLVSDLLGFPRHLSQHVGGFVITRSPLCELVPIENAAMPDRTVIEWDKDDIEAAGMLKVDVLGLGMLTALRRCLTMVNQNYGTRYDLAGVPQGDAGVYAMMHRADTVGVFQIESRAQMSMLPRLKPKEFYDLVIEVAIVRPGPIQGGMVHPYLRRREGKEKPDELPEAVPAAVRAKVKAVLDRTLGVPLFQEQCMALAVDAAGFTPGEADQFRRAMASWKRKGDQIYRFGKKLIEGMIANRLPREFAERCFEQVKGFSEYGFPESHAASFAILVYVSAWLKHHYPAEFTASLLNSQPMGFYAPAQLIRDAREHGVEVLPVDVNHSGWESRVESGRLRLGMSLVNGMSKPDADAIRRATLSTGTFRSVLSLWRAGRFTARAMRRLAAADAFSSMGLSRQQALWETRLLRDEPLPLFEKAEEAAGSDDQGLDRLPAVAPSRQVICDYASVGFSLRAHPVCFVREKLDRMDVHPCAVLKDAAQTPHGKYVAVAGIVLVRQRPGTAKDVTFITLEDETAIANLVVWKRVYQRFRREARARMLIAEGHVQREGDIVHVVVTKMRAIDGELAGLEVSSRNFH